MTTPTAETFAALARSSPWRWSTLRFAVSWSGGPIGTGSVRAWLRRPDLLRVEHLDGGLIQVVREAPRSGGGREPVLRPDGLVDRRPDRRWEGDWTAYDAPMYQNYHWVAMLDPVELVDGVDRDTGSVVRAVVVDELLEVEHGGRPAWEAVVRTTPAYEPRCGCCPLLRSREVDLLEFEHYPEQILTVYPDAYRVRLDVGTGVCVYTEEIGGLAPGPRHGVWIEAVDEPMDDELFASPRHGLFRRPQ